MNHNFQKFKKKVEQLFNHYNAGNYTFVIQQVNILLKKQPKNQFILNLLGSSHHKMGNLNIAQKIFLHVIQLDENNLASINNLANVYKDLSRFKEAEDLYEKILNKDPNYINAVVNYGSLKFQLNQFDDSIALYKRGLKLNKDSLIIHYNLGLVYQSLGNFDEAKSSFKEVLRIDPNMNIVDRMMSRFIKYNENNDHLISMLEKIKYPNLNNESRINLSFALGKAYEDLADYEKSFFYLEKGNKLKNKTFKYNANIDDQLFNSISNIFKDYNFENVDHINKNYKQIIFIVGLPRSGTSLIEQILSSHSEIYGAGELDFLEKLIRKSFYIDNKFKLPNLTDSNNLNLFPKISKDYLELINQFKIKEHIVTDKAPLNFRWIGFIKIFFPDAKVVHCMRDPRDNCLSLYKNIFDENQNWTYNQADILNYYKNYKNLMDFWKIKLPNFIYDCNYENIINNPDIEIKNLIKFCDLEWENQCLEFHKAKRAIKTVSVAQARKPLYKTSISSNKNYSLFLKDFFDKLNTLSS